MLSLPREFGRGPQCEKKGRGDSLNLIHQEYVHCREEGEEV